MVSKTHFSHLWTDTRSYPFDANLGTTVGPFVHIVFTGGDCVGADVDEVRSKVVRRWEYRLNAAYVSEFV